MFDWITGLMDASGYVGIAALMFLENLFPPIPSELIMPLAGYMAAQGRIGFVGAVAAGTLGSLASTLIWYYLGRTLGEVRLARIAAKHGRWIALTPDDVTGVSAWFRRRHGATAVLLGRLVPGVRTLISIPAGIALMPLHRFIAYSAVGTLGWTVLLTAGGYLLGSRFVDVSGWVNPVSNVVILVAVAAYIWRVVTFPKPKLVDTDRTAGPGPTA